MKKKIIITSLILCVITAVLTTIESVASSAEVAALTAQEAKLMEQRSELDATLLRAVSISDLEERSREIGFIKPLELVYLGGSANVASKN